MSNIPAEIERQRRLAWDAKEKAMAERLMQRLDVELVRNPPTTDEPNPVEHALKVSFIAWCNEKGVRSCPAKPATVAAYLLDHRTTTPHDQLLEMLTAIGHLHDKFNLANPCATKLVRYVLALTVEDKAPRSWRRDEALHWAQLPIDVRYTITRREKDRDRALHIAWDKAADARKKYETKTENQTKPNTTNGSGEANISP